MFRTADLAGDAQRWTRRPDEVEVVLAPVHGARVPGDPAFRVTASIGKRRAGFRSVYWKDKDPFRNRRRERRLGRGRGARRRPTAREAAADRAARGRRTARGATAQTGLSARRRTTLEMPSRCSKAPEPDQRAPNGSRPRGPTSPDGFDFFPDIDERDDNNQAPSPPPGAWWWDRDADLVSRTSAL